MSPEVQTLKLVCIEVHVHLTGPVINFRQVSLEISTVVTDFIPLMTCVSSANEVASVPGERESAIQAMCNKNSTGPSTVP